MPKICYLPDLPILKNVGKLKIVKTANTIIADYRRQGLDLTLRQLYYQFVSKDLIPNTDKSYKHLGSVINDARLAGILDWDAIVDRTRNLRTLPSWDTPQEGIDAITEQYRIDKWARQPYRVEVWIEKDALLGVIASICNGLQVPYFSCRGYTSQSEMWRAAMRLAAYEGQTPRIIHLGDHDPSGVDMSRDISDRITLFTGRTFAVERIALNYDQIQQYDPPPNPAKVSDSRARKYIDEFGHESWELDALNPVTLRDLITTAVMEVRDEDAWAEAEAEEETHRDQLKLVSGSWDDVVARLEAE